MGNANAILAGEMPEKSASCMRRAGVITVTNVLVLFTSAALTSNHGSVRQHSDALRCQRPPWRRRTNSSAPPSIVSDGAAGERCRTPRAATSRPPASPSTTAGDSIEELPPFETDGSPTRSARKIITRNDSPDIGFDRSINPYRGCEHGCVYCFARPTHANMGLSPGLDFESKLFAKPDAPDCSSARSRRRKAISRA